MELSRLDVKGFKSFGDKISINFDSGITGIVGPNGCGKSNVVDAIRWVLGEQKTRNLRSEKMEDVIFNGTKDRKAHQMAEVSITFNNTRNLLPTEYSQVTVTRRYFRTGESDYELNGVSCRLKDINNLFLDTGIGSDSYAIIELKMVEDILNDRDGSRRELFEEAAGVSKFKIRKKQTLRKLEDTDKDLMRVEDLLFEIDKNLKSLEKQAKQAEKYYELKGEYKKYSISYAKIAISNSLFEMAELQKKSTIESDGKNTIQAAILNGDAEIEKIKKEIVLKEQQLKESQKKLNDHMTKIRTYESENKIKNERLKYLTDTQERLIRQLQSDKELKEKSEILIKSIAQEYESLNKQLNEQEAKVEKLKIENEEQKTKTTALQNRLTELNNQVQNKQKLVYDLSKSLELSTFQISSLKQELEKTTSDSSSQTNELTSFEDKIKELAAQTSEKQLYLLEIETDEAENNETLTEIDEKIKKSKDELVLVTRSSDAKQNEYNLTKSLVENLEGFPEAVRFLKRNANWVKDVPLLSDILTCDEKYRIPIENYLESYMNYYIVETETDAIKAVNLLSDASMGKANFFVISQLNTLKTNTYTTIENAKPAISLIEFDPKYKSLIDYLLGGVYLIDEKDSATISLAENQFQALISENGKIIKRKQSISGGSVGLFEGKRIGRAKNLEILERDIKKLNEKITELKQIIAHNDERFLVHKSKSKKVEIEQLQREFNQIKQEYIAYSSKKEQLTSLVQKNSGRREEILEKIDLLQREAEINKPKVEQSQSELTTIQDSIEGLKEEVETEVAKMNQKSTAFNEQNIIYYQLNNKFSSLEQDLDYRKTNISSTAKRIDDATAELAKVEADTKQVLSKAEVNDDELTALYAEKEKLEFELNETEKTYYATRGQVDSIEKQLKELQRQKENADFIIQETNNKINESKLRLAGVKERLSVEFEINLDEIQNQELDETVSEAELKIQIDRIKNAMERIGQINPMAMEAYNEIKERNDLITKQKADISDAKKSLMDTISEIDTTAKTQFETTFVAIRENFIKVFRSLFTEDDNCDLVLSDPNDPLESDIDIMAKPKGKRPQSINQLSGGEKTLTAVALLFAIYLIKPAPFCIFDEVDAPLDDANIDKFNTIIKKFSGESQFIIVTHNKRTMASTDVIYGVTMIETGISRVVPVDLRNLN
ncbi:MAG: chromosome segregation protein SMC [Bacteroidetes bacterium]|nr:MAG: chromosome segregation protein SMC [Bacteroidota bacterium]